MKRTVVCASLLVALLGTAAPVWAQAQPVVVVSIASLDHLVEDAAYGAKLAGNEDAAGGIKQAVEAFAEAVDTTKPWGAMLEWGAEGPSILGFVPVKDLEKFLQMIPPQFGQAEDAGDGIKRIAAGPEQAVFVKQQGAWAYIAQTPEKLAALPGDPTSFLGKLPEEYDIAVRANMQALTEEQRAQAMALIRFGASTGMAPLDGEDEDAFQLRQQVMEKNLEQFEKMMSELDQITLGLALDSQGKSAFAEFAITAVDGTDYAKRMVALEDAKTMLSGFVPDSAIGRASGAQEYPEEDIEQLLALIAQFRTQAAAEVDKSDEFPNEDAKEKVKEIIDDLLDVAEATTEEGKIDFSLGVLGPQAPFKFLAAMQVEKADSLEGVLKRVADIVAVEDEKVKIELNVEEAELDGVGEVSFHTVSGPIDEQGAKLLGPDAKLTIGISENHVYVALGEAGISAIKSGIKSAAAGGEQPGYTKGYLHLKPLLEIAAEEKPETAVMLGAIGESGDKIVVDSFPVKNGMRVRYTLEEGLLKMAAQAAAMGAAQAFAPPPGAFPPPGEIPGNEQ